MMLEELIYKRFTDAKDLVGHLASFNGAPAVFSPEPPDKDQDGWGGNVQYPEVIYNFDLQANEERHSAGTLSVSLLCQNTTAVMPEALEPLVRDCLRDVVLKPAGGNPYCCAWARTDAFTIEESVRPRPGEDGRFHHRGKERRRDDRERGPVRHPGISLPGDLGSGPGDGDEPVYQRVISRVPGLVA